MSKILKVGIASLALALVSTAASAESFTFSGSGKSGDQVMVMADGHVSGGGYATNTSDAVMASGKKLSSKGACEQWTTDPGSIFSSQGVCTAEDSTGTYSVEFSCQADAKNTMADCWGRFTGDTGAYAKKMGMGSWHSVSGMDHKSFTFEGTGQWN